MLDSRDTAALLIKSKNFSSDFKMYVLRTIFYVSKIKWNNKYWIFHVIRRIV